MSKISDAFNNGKALITFVMAGDPSINKTHDIILSLAASGSDIIEIGIPFSDSIADGPVIVEAANRAIEKGVSVNDIFALTKKVRRKSEIPLVVMTSLNIVSAYGIEKFFAGAGKAGINGAILPDLSVEESYAVSQIAKNNGVDLIFLVSPNSSQERMKAAADATSGFLYMVSLTGTTGKRKALSEGLLEFSKSLRSITDKPIAIGFGISDTKQAHAAAQFADGVIVGSALVDLIHKSKGQTKKISSFAAALKASISRP